MRSLKKMLIVVVLFVPLIAVAQTSLIDLIKDSDIRDELNNLHQEMCSCIAFFSTGLEAVKRKGASDEALESTQEARAILAEVAFLLHKEEITKARLELEMNQLVNVEMRDDFANFSILLLKYGASCKELTETVREKVVDLLTEAKEKGLISE